MFFCISILGCYWVTASSVSSLYDKTCGIWKTSPPSSEPLTLWQTLWTSSAPLSVPGLCRHFAACSFHTSSALRGEGATPELHTYSSTPGDQSCSSQQAARAIWAPVCAGVKSGSVRLQRDRGKLRLRSICCLQTTAPQWISATLQQNQLQDMQIRKCLRNNILTLDS